VTIKLDGEATGGRFAIFEDVLPHGAAPPLHSHPEDETFYLLDGEMSVWLARRGAQAGAGLGDARAGRHAAHVPRAIRERAGDRAEARPRASRRFARRERRRRETPSGGRRLERDFGMTRHGPPPGP